MWFGTKVGLNRYDGHSFQVYQHDPATQNSLSNNTIWSMCEDRLGTLWFGTSQGLNQFNKRSNTFRRFNLAIKHQVSNNTIWSVYEDRSGTLWLGTSMGLNKFDKATATFTLYAHDRLGDAWTYNTIHTIYEDRAGNLWVGTNQGLSLFDPQTGRFTRFNPIKYTAATGQVFPHAVKAIYEDRAGVLWIGTTGSGLQQFDRRTHTFKAYRHDPFDAYSISDNFILSIREDSFGVLWIATRNKGLNRLQRNTAQFTHYLHEETNDQSISGNSLICLYQDRYKVLWVGTYAAGVNKVDLLRKQFAHFKYEPAVKTSLLDNYVYALTSNRAGAIWVSTRTGLNKLDRQSGRATHYSYNIDLDQHSDTYIAHCLYEDRAANLWLGLGGGGLKKFDPVRRDFTRYVHHPADSHSLPHDFVKAILEDKRGVLWIGTHRGLCRLERVGRFIRYDPSPSQPLHINCMLEAPDGILWLATDKDGLVRFDSNQNTFVRYNLPDGNSQNANMLSLYHDRAGILWLGTESGQLYRFNQKTTAFTLVNYPGLVKTVINGILEDEQGNLWMSTRAKGVIKFNPVTKATRHYEVSDGLQGNEFNKAFCQSANGELCFGGNNGFNVFHPDSIHDNPYAPPVVIRGFKVFDQPRSFTQDPIVLPYRDNFFSFDFAALHYALPEKNRYAYRLEGVDKAWIQAGTRHDASYTNLDPGQYVLRVKAANYDGVWNQRGTTVHIIITPPWWRTRWAYLGYGLVVVVGLLLARRDITRRERLNADLRIQQLESDKLRELDMLKSRFFANISHEFRTPLTLISGLLQANTAALEAEPTEIILRPQDVRVMRRNTQRLLELINQLLDLSRLEEGKLHLEPKVGDINHFLKGLAGSFASQAEYRRIGYRCDFPADKVWVKFDEDKLQKIVDNLLSNAFKFTMQGGEVTITACYRKETSLLIVLLTITDTGIGIAPEELPRIFDRFFQVDATTTRAYEGSGIGLALTKELVELHGGKISVTSNVGQGSQFKVELPFFIVQTDEKASSTALEDKLQAVDNEEPVDTRRASLPLVYQTKVLVVEDNDDLRHYIQEHLSPHYRVLEARDGKAGLAVALSHLPDVVISDVMMPGLDGYSLCRALKANPATSHIPLILLTARAGRDNRIEGLQTGADDYLTKPFDLRELAVRTSNLIDSRRRLRERFSREMLLTPPQLPLPSADEKFLQRILAIVEPHLADADFDVDELGQQAGMSRSQLYRKLYALTNHSPSDFLRTMRLRRAAQLLTARVGSVSEVAYQVGYKDASHFSKSFTKHFGLSPSEYLLR